MERNTGMRLGDSVSIPVAAATTIEVGNMVAINSNGYAVHASGALVVGGVADETVDNSQGNNGDVNVIVRRNLAFLFDNDGSVTTRALFGDVYIVDSKKVSVTEVTNAVAGKCIGVDGLGANGVWVEI